MTQVAAHEEQVAVDCKRIQTRSVRYQIWTFQTDRISHVFKSNVKGNRLIVISSYYCNEYMDRNQCVRADILGMCQDGGPTCTC